MANETPATREIFNQSGQKIWSEIKNKKNCSELPEMARKIGRKKQGDILIRKNTFFQIF